MFQFSVAASLYQLLCISKAETSEFVFGGYSNVPYLCLAGSCLLDHWIMSFSGCDSQQLVKEERVATSMGTTTGDDKRLKVMLLCFSSL